MEDIEYTLHWSQTSDFQKTIPFIYDRSAHFAAYLLSPKYFTSESELTESEQEIAMSFIEDNFSLNFPNTVLLKLKSQKGLFRPSMFNTSTDSSLSDNDWWNVEINTEIG